MNQKYKIRIKMQNWQEQFTDNMNNQYQNKRLFGMLIDVSGSMRESYEQIGGENIQQNQIDKTRLESVWNLVFTSIQDEKLQNDYLFAGAFGCKDEKQDVVDFTPILKSLLEKISQNDNQDWYQLLYSLVETEAKNLQTYYTIKNLRKDMPEFLVFLIYVQFKNNNYQFKRFISNLPAQVKQQSQSFHDLFIKSSSMLSDKLFNYDFVNQNIQTQLKELKQQLIGEKISILSIRKITRPLKNKLIRNEVEAQTQMLEEFKQISYGRTPMKKCLKLTLNNDYEMFKDKFLFIISDGESTDGDPTEYAQQLKNKGFMIVCFYISTSRKIDDTQMYHNAQSQWEEGAKIMFEMSSVVSNFDYPLCSIGQHTNIKLSQIGKSRLFLQGNDPNLMNKFFNYFIKIKNEQDALINLIGKVNIEQYINSSNQFEAQEQEGGTCYANAIAAVYELIMQKIYKREGGYPTFEKIRQDLIQQYGTEGGNTFKIVTKTCSSFRLQCRELKSISDIKQCLHQERPLLARFYLCDDQWDSKDPNRLGFKPFFANNPKGILKNLPKDQIRMLEDMQLYYINQGFFKVKDLEVLCDMQFMEVFWTNNNLTKKEIQSFKQDAGQKITDFYQDAFSIIGNKIYTCPKCLKPSFINEYEGNYYKAKCPRCKLSFHPQSLGQLFVNYLYGKDL
ncbi:unnamed protein product [Paramecium sonneborni]|uniref:VWFA domain-containing protein n=1 Tax=Paramecium sonneborni TaxID=65129 RepID=A0A8S1RSJ7_9CILI|nr:unnamed protein product [Paramecium sonneborni]